MLWQARIEKLCFELAGNFEGVVPSIYATFGCDVRINELYLVFCKTMSIVSEKRTGIFGHGGRVIVDNSPSWVINDI
jgi:hypothetical protein